MQKIKPINKETLVHLMPRVQTKRNGQSVKPEECISLLEVVNSYLTGQIGDIDYSKRITKVRKLKGTRTYDKLKTSLPAYRIGYGPGKQINPLVPIDEENGKCTVPEESVFFRAKSIGGKDSVVIVRIPDTSSRDEWKEKAKRIQELYGLPSNKGQINIDRCRIISLDPQIKVNWNAIPLSDNVVKWDEQGNNELYTQAKVERVALNNGTALSVFAYLCGRKTEDEAIQEMETFNYEGSKSLSTKQLRAKEYQKWLASYGKIWQENRLRYTSQNKDNILYNEITCGLCYKVPNSVFALPISNKFLTEMWEAQPKKGRLAITPFRDTLIAKAAIYNPLKELFSIEWSGVDQFAKLKKYIKVEHESFFEDLKKHIIRGIHMLFTPVSSPDRYINRFVFVLQSEETNIGKSVLIRKITLNGLVPGFSSEFSFDDKEYKTLMCTIPNLINEEVDSQTQNELRHLKDKISFSGSFIRHPYDIVATEMTRKATLWATVNPRDFLNSVHDRWIIHPVISIDFKYSKVVDFIDLWRQCYAIWKSDPFAGELKQEEVKANSAKAEEHKYYSPLETFIDTIFEAHVNFKDVTPLSVNEIVTVLDGRNEKLSEVNPVYVGRALQRLFPLAKYPGGRFNGKRGSFYYLRERAK